jgi:hypothetical protein
MNELIGEGAIQEQDPAGGFLAVGLLPGRQSTGEAGVR